MKALRSFYYYGSLSTGLLRMFPAVAAEAMLLRFWPYELSEGIRIVDPLPETRAGFVVAVKAALTLIETNDPRRFARLGREVRAIINIPVFGGAEYCRFLKSCHIDLRAFPLSPYHDSAITLLACRLIHEATHGHLCTKKVLQHRHYPRVERLCKGEEVRFARKLGLDLPKDWCEVPEDAKPQIEERRRFASEQKKRLFGSRPHESVREGPHESG